MALVDEVRAWLFEAALPLWGGVGVDRAGGGFVEELDLDGRPRELDYKRTRVTCRQIYVFSHAALMGWSDGAALSDHGYAFLRRAALDEGWARRLTPDGRLLDATIDLYDQAFVLFALAWRRKLTGEAEPVVLAHRLVDFLQARIRAANGLGYTHEHAPGGWRWQNPHMHLLEASLAMAEASGEERFLELAGEIVGLFRGYFFDGHTLAEYFAADLQRAPGEAGRSVEPGHMFEWAWILAQYQKLAGDVGAASEVRSLVANAEALGVDPASQATYNEITPGGQVSNAASRAWPNTERIKGALALAEIDGAGRFPQPAAAAARLLLDRYLNVTPRGSWIDLFDAQGAPVSRSAPASTLYHVALSFAEILRLAPRLAA
jgi:N-acylglucosamine 2-epimerase/mannose-6-phosphate isomerase